jgi:serine/threonine-protein kinase
MTAIGSSVPACLGPYRVNGVVGQGGTAIVHSAIDEREGRRVAVKVLQPRHGASPARRARFEREVRLVESLRHPHIIEAIGSGVDEDRAYFVMELVEGETLAARLARSGRLTIGEIAAVFLPVCSAVAATHDKGIVHRDLKPSNVMLARGPGGDVVPKLIDFGIARTEAPGDALVTDSDVVLGTIHYLAPNWRLAQPARAFRAIFTRSVSCSSSVPPGSSRFAAPARITRCSRS